ncbi:MAG: N-acetylmuramoyl-L-alanine amidase [Burkholderiales bacterium]|nr:N-acetylmuramoyl-L-alanine amidase [Opitutaceae bacterium]
MPFPEIDAPSPNFAAEPPHERLGVCFHHTVLSFADTLAHMARPESRVSYHVVIAADGTRARLVADEKIAWHAGVSSFQGRDHGNAFLLGVSFAGDTHAARLTDAQIASALEWLAPRWTPLGWSLAWMTDHRQIAPGRKDDLAPGEWTRLRAAIAERFGEA